MKNRVLNKMNRKIWKRVLSVTLAATLLMTAVPVDVRAGNGTPPDTGIEAVSGNADTEIVPTGISLFAEEAAGDIFDGTTITLNKLTLKASYKDENGNTVVQDLNKDNTIDLPYDADINMSLDFVMGSADSLEEGKTYIYQLPDSIRVDVDATHELSDRNGNSIGKVHIAKDGSLSFQFYKDKIGTNKNVGFFVRFEGGFSDDLQEAGKQEVITFPTGNGDFQFTINTTDKTGTDTEEPDQPGEPEQPDQPDQPGLKDIGISKSGNRIINVNGKNYIEWTVELLPNGRDELNGTLIDQLPPGLKYAAIDGYPLLGGQNVHSGNITTTAQEGDTSIEIKLEHVKTYYNVQMKFCTYYDNAIFDGALSGDTNQTITNTAMFNPDDEDKGVTDSATVTIRPELLDKRASSIDADGNITWTVTLNREKLDLQGAVYQDVVKAGHELDYASISVSPAVGTVSETAEGFKLEFPKGTEIRDSVTITYQTKVTDFLQSSYQNHAELTGDIYNVVRDASVQGYQLFKKEAKGFNFATNTFTWEITVNESGVPLKDVVVTDTFAAGDKSHVANSWERNMVFVSASETMDDSSDPDNGKLVFKFDELSEKKVITIVTRVENPESYNENDWVDFFNYGSLISSMNPDSALKSQANQHLQIKQPDLMQNKWGNSPQNGEIRWGFGINKQTVPIEKMIITDYLPEGVDYKPGNFWLDGKTYKEPQVTKDSVSGRTVLTYVISAGDEEAKLLANGFQVQYLTKIVDPEKAMANTSYTNDAAVSVTYEGDIDVTDGSSATVTGESGGILNKTYRYNSGDQYVDWTVTVNEAHTDMSGINNPVIEDQLAEYFDYDGGSLTRIDSNGVSSPVSAADYMISVVNGKVVVQLPNIGTDCYQFTFRTQFNCFAAELDGKTIKNTVDFVGSGMNYSKESGSINNVSFESSSAGSSVKKEIRVKKIDADTKAPLPGAKFELYLGDVCIGEAESGADGYAVFEDSDSVAGYTLKLVEVQAPDGYVIVEDGEAELTEYTDENLKTDQNGIRYYEIEIENKSTKTVETGDIKLEKTNAEGVKLSDAVFGLYSDAACQTEVARRTTTDGQAAFSGMAQGTYYLKEISSPEGYKVSSVIVEVMIAKTGDAVTVTYDGESEEPVFVDEKAVGSLEITKQEQGTASLLPGATFSIYNDVQCTDEVDTQVTGANGKVVFGNLELGKTYYYREVIAPAGYILDNSIRKITIGTGTETTDQTETVVIENQKAIGDIVITKVDNSAIAKPLLGVTFRLLDQNGDPFLKDGAPYEVTSDDKGIAVFEDIPFGSYKIRETEGKTGYKVSADAQITVDIVGDNPVTIVNTLIQCNIKVVKLEKGNSSTYLPGAEIGLFTKDGLQVKRGITNVSGEIIFNDIPYGDYYIKELNAPDGYKLSDAQINISASEIEAGDGTTIQRSLEDEKENGKIRLKKTDELTNALSGAEFTLYDADMKAIATTKSMTAEEAAAAATGATEGSAEFTALAYGTYYLQETKAPDGYLRDARVYKVVVSTDDYTEVYTTESNTTAPLVIVNEKLDTTPPVISVKLKKTDSETNAALANAVFELYKDGASTGITAVTGSDGIAYFKTISLEDYTDTSVYSLVEKTAPAGYKITSGTIQLGKGSDLDKYSDTNPDAPLSEAAIAWAGGTEASATVENEPMKGSIWITKTGQTAAMPLKGAEFMLYESDMITPVSIAGLANPAVTSDTGVAVFDNLPCGTYYVRETKAPEGYTINSVNTKVVVVDETPAEISLKDTPINVSISKKAVSGIDELPGAEFEIFKKNDVSQTVIDSWISTDTIHLVPFEKLEVNTTYILSETKAPTGYGYMEDIEFTVNADGSITTTAEKSGQTIIARDLPVDLSIAKVDEAAGTQLAGAKLAIYDASGTKLTEFTTGITSYTVPLGLLSVPRSGYLEYELRELEAPFGYDVASPVLFAVRYDGGVYRVEESGGNKEYQPLAGNRLVMEDRIKVESNIYIRKLSQSSGLELSGAKFTIYETGNTTNVIDSWTSNGTPYKLDATLLITDTVYTLSEVSAPAGYLKAEDVQFKIDAAGDIVLITGNADNLNADKDTILVRDQSIELKVRKQDGFGSLLKGASLKISEYDGTKPDGVGKEVVSFASVDGDAYKVLASLLKADATYVLQETDAPAGYEKAENIIFTIAADGSISRQDGVAVTGNTIVMVDKEAGLGIGKISLNNGLGLAGSKLTLTAVDDPSFTTQTWVSDGHVKTWDITEFTPGCSYTLTEVEAPKGYAYADPIVFTVGADDHQIYIDGKLADDKTVYIADGKLELTVSKQDLTTNKELVGAQLGIYDTTGNLVTSWTSGTTPHMVDTSEMTTVSTGYAEYVLKEMNAPTGYRKALDIRFAFDRDGAVYLVTENASGGKEYTLVGNNKLTMYDDAMLSVRKLNSSGGYVEGAKLSITAKDDDSFTPITWVSDGAPYYVQDGLLAPGVTYILKEEEVPQGYTYAKEIEFELDHTGKLFIGGEPIDNMRIVMLDYPIALSVSKQDAGSKAGLAGAKLVIKNVDGEIVHSFVSTKAKVTLPSGVFKTPKPGAYEYYSLCELEAPTGYQVAEQIDFAIDSDGKLYVKNKQGTYTRVADNTIVMLDEVKPTVPDVEEPGEGGGTTTPGDGGDTTTPGDNGGTTTPGNGGGTTTPGNGGSTTTTTPGGNGGTTTTVKNPIIPKTGDDTPLGMLIALCMIGLVGAGTMFGGYFYKKRRR